MSDTMTRIENIRMERDKVIEFYSWLLEEDNFKRAIVIPKGSASMADFTPERCEAALENWRTVKPDAGMLVTVDFPDDADAVLFKLKFIG